MDYCLHLYFIADSSPKKQQKKDVESEKPVVKSGGGGGGLFDEEEDDDDDFFPTGTESKKGKYFKARKKHLRQAVLSCFRDI